MKNPAALMNHCINCRKPKPVFKRVEGGTVEGTAGTRRRPGAVWCRECWEENVRFNEESRRRSEEKFKAELRAMGLNPEEVLSKAGSKKVVAQ